MRHLWEKALRRLWESSETALRQLWERAHVQLLFTWKPSPLRSSKFSFEYLLTKICTSHFHPGSRQRLRQYPHALLPLTKQLWEIALRPLWDICETSLRESSEIVWLRQFIRTKRKHERSKKKKRMRGIFFWCLNFRFCWSRKKFPPTSFSQGLNCQIIRRRCPKADEIVDKKKPAAPKGFPRRSPNPVLTGPCNG